VQFSPDRCQIISGSDDETIQVWDATAAAEVLPTIQGHTDIVASVAFSPDGSRIVSGSHDKTVQVWDLKTGDEVAALPNRLYPVESVVFSPDGSVIAFGTRGGSVYIWLSMIDNSVSNL
jgi:WD40 repeat protein